MSFDSSSVDRAKLQMFAKDESILSNLVKELKFEAKKQKCAEKKKARQKASYREAKALLSEVAPELKSQTDFERLRDEGKLPDSIPNNPELYYIARMKRGLKFSWKDFLSS